jgi:hypothetical protein
MIRRLAYALLCVPLVCLTLWAQKEPDYHTGRLLKVSNQSYALPDSAGKTAYLLHILDGSNEYFPLYNANFIFGRDRSSQLKPDSDIQYRISGKYLFLTTQDSKEIKGSLCKKVIFAGSPCIKRGDLLILGNDAA